MRFSLIFSLGLLLTCLPALAQSTDTLQQEVIATETAFAKTMADRNHQAFASFISEQAVFFSGNQPTRGKAAIVDLWKTYYEKEKAPFSWRPETVAVLESGDLALSSGPVYNEKGELIAYFNSTWQKEKDGHWRIVFDKGFKACPEEKLTQ